MKTNLIETLINIDNDDINNLVRMLILIDVFSGEKFNGKIEGITKLSILDFLLKYPNALNKTLDRQEFQGNEKVSKKKLQLELQSYEVNSIEATMMQFNFAPWDYKYRRIISILKAKDLINVELKGKKNILKVTTKGRAITDKIKLLKNYEHLIVRCKIIKSIFGGWSQKKLIDMIYITFPEILKIKKDVIL